MDGKDEDRRNVSVTPRLTNDRALHGARLLTKAPEGRNKLAQGEALEKMARRARLPYAVPLPRVVGFESARLALSNISTTCNTSCPVRCFAAPARSCKMHPGFDVTIIGAPVSFAHRIFSSSSAVDASGCVTL